MFSTAAIVMALSFNAFAGTPEKAEAKPEVKTEPTTHYYRYQSTNPNGSINFVEGQNNSCDDGEKPCNWESSVPLTSPMTTSELESNPNVTITEYRS